jgi:hypothetical protein
VDSLATYCSRWMGCLYRAPCKEGILVALEDATRIADFSKLQFEPIEAPPEFRRWPSR